MILETPTRTCKEIFDQLRIIYFDPENRVEVPADGYHATFVKVMFSFIEILWIVEGVLMGLMFVWWTYRRKESFLFIRWKCVSGVQFAIFMLLVGRWMGGVGKVGA